LGATRPPASSWRRGPHRQGARPHNGGGIRSGGVMGGRWLVPLGPG
jgi:hypothetical protein